ncbi:hypothetical protein BJP40_16480 [Streptomyces sp. CC53]|uniref:hypothetical protein n=1 Tax=Streptomyces sp. CC77 TaxID=1906739 RepID=UPI0008DCEF97|nr:MULTISPECIES: hypothetical protein [unclassified Streptomyces]OII65642.1 hypothetical protein BJP40_16480 [Streptomyces sp. CC53]OII69591.1 hypothetical protein BJP39_16995 [Streptomyces sp. CC77]
MHGVGGATPQGMLDDPRTVRVTGDGTAAVYRRADDADAESRPDRFRDGPVPEAYVWSNLTSGNGSRALWLLLLPFMVVNLAHWMRPAASGGRGGSVRLYGVLVRLVALTLTVLLTAAACEVALDLVAWQCAGTAACTGGRGWLSFLAAAEGGWWSQPGRRLTAAALVPTALVALLWYLSHRTWSAYESQRPPRGEAGPGAGEATEPPHGDRPALGRPGFWYGRRLVARLRAAHTAAGLLTVAAAVAGAAARHDRGGDSAPLAVLGWCVEGALLAGGCTAAAVVCRRGRSERHLDQRLDGTLITWLPGSAAALLVVAALYASWSRPGWTSSGSLPGDATFGVIALAQGCLVLALAAVAVRLYRRAPAPRTALRGLAGPAVAMLACALGGLMAGGVAQRVADWLAAPAAPGLDRGALAGPPVMLSWQAAAIPAVLLTLLVPVAYLAGRTAVAALRLAPVVEAEYADERPDPVRTRTIARIRAAARLTDAAPGLAGLLAGATLLLGTVGVAGAWLTGEVPGTAFDGAPAALDGAAEAAQSLGSWLVGLGFLLFVTWGRRAYRDASARRTIGILWDVGTFWPRAAHPFAPPCYAERAVPDLTWRMASWTGRTGGRLVISGHSQGSVLAAAAVWQLPAATRRRVALLTYGSPLERLYGRWFPAYFGRGPLTGLRHDVHCWRNLWRHTDPIGGPVGLPADAAGREVDHPVLRDPVVYGRTGDHPLPEPVLGHSDYQADPAFARERTALLDRLPLPADPLSSVPTQRGAGPDDGRGPDDGHGQGACGRSSG